MRSLPVLISLVAVITGACSLSASSQPSAADMIAEKFAAASPSEPAPKHLDDKAAVARQKAIAAKKRADTARAIALRREEEAARLHTQDEADLLARAKAELAERMAEQRRAEEDALRADTEARKAAEYADAQVAEAARKAQAEQLAEAEAQRRVIENRKREDAARASAAAAEQKSKEVAEAAETERRAALEAQREAETLRLAERLKEARRAKAAELDQHEKVAQQQPPAKIALNEHRSGEAIDAANGAVPLQPSAPKEALPAPAAAPPPSVTPTTLATASSRASVLLVLEPGDYGIRRFNRNQADPVLCAGETCYISQGPDAPARAMPRTQALGPGNTLGGRAGACKQQLACVFRDVDLGASGKANIMPVDLHVVRHDRREVTTIEADQTCTNANGRLACGSPVKSATYRVLAVPETVAAKATPPGLSAALESLASARTAAR